MAVVDFIQSTSTKNTKNSIPGMHQRCFQNPGYWLLYSCIGCLSPCCTAGASYPHYRGCLRTGQEGCLQHILQVEGSALKIGCILWQYGSDSKQVCLFDLLKLSKKDLYILISFQYPKRVHLLVADGQVVRAGVLVAWNVLSWSGGQEFKAHSVCTLGA